MHDDELRARLEGLLRPSSTELRRARKAVIRVLDDGAVHHTASLVTAAAQELEADVRLGNLVLRFSGSPTDGPGDVLPDNPAVLLARARLAGQWAVADLAVTGCIVPAVGPAGQSSHEPHAESILRFGVTTPRHSGGLDVAVVRPYLALGYVRSGGAPKWFLNPDIFLEDVALPLDERALRTLREALESFRRGLYLAAAALLGVVSEAAWYAAARKLTQTRALEQAVAEGATAKVQKLVAEALRAVPGVATAVDDLHSFGALLRALRNYGVHPRRDRNDLERYFAEEECGLLILRMHHYLVELAGLVQRVEGRSTESVQPL